MKIKIIDFGYSHLPLRAHYNDAGADVYACIKTWSGKHEVCIPPHGTAKIPLGLGLVLPDGYAACVFPRSGLSSKGVVCELPPIDSGYRGEIHAIIHNGSDEEICIKDGDRVGQLVIFPVVIADFVTETGPERNADAFGSTGE